MRTRTAAALERLRALPVRDAAVAAGLLGRRRVPTYWWLRRPNFGDLLGPAVLHRQLGVRPVWVSREYAGKVLSVGSILFALQEGDVVWGAGLMGDRRRRPPAGVEFRAVRGPLTRANLDAEVPEVYGDPACLLPLFHDAPVATRFEVGVVPHYADAAQLPTDDPRVAVVDVLRPWPEVVDRIRACEVVLSSSLHGVVVAEAYGIPAVWMWSPDVGGKGFKFRDYYLGSGREPMEPARWGDGLAAADRPAPPAEHDRDGLLAAWRSSAEA